MVRQNQPVRGAKALSRDEDETANELKVARIQRSGETKVVLLRWESRPRESKKGALRRLPSSFARKGGQRIYP